MDNTPIDFTPASLAKKFLALAWSAIMLLAMSAGLSACDRRSETTPANPPAANGSGDSASREVRTPTAPDTRGGGSSGFKGTPPTADTSGGPSSGGDSPGASSSTPAPAVSAASAAGHR